MYYPSMKKLANTVNQNLPWFFTLSLVVLWEVAGWLGALPKFIIPRPTEILVALVKDWPNIWHNAQVTLIQALIGLAIGIVLAFILAILMDRFSMIYKALYPLLIITQTIPTVALAPILVLWLGYDMTPKIVLVVLTTLFPIVISILEGFAQCDKDAIQLLELMGAKPGQVLRHVKLPAAMTYFLSGLRVSVSYAFISSVVAEWLGGFVGLGVYMIQTKKAFSYDRMFAVIVFISTLSLLSMALVKLAERLIVPWMYRDKKGS